MLAWKFQENYNTPRYRTPVRQYPGNANYESGIPAYSLLVKVYLEDHPS